LFTQLPIEAGRYLYGEAAGAQISRCRMRSTRQIFISPCRKPRDIDIGFAGDIYWPFLGDRDAPTSSMVRGGLSGAWPARCIERAACRARNGTCFSMGCKALVGARSGTY
jgi:hypothetical protein